MAIWHEKLAQWKSYENLEKIEKKYAEKLANREFTQALGLQKESTPKDGNSDEATLRSYQLNKQWGKFFKKHLKDIQLKRTMNKVRRYREL